MRVLVISDDYWHPGQVPTDGLAPLKEQGFDFEILTDMTDFDPEIMKDYNVVLLAKSEHISQQNNENSWKTDVVQNAFVEYVENGGGFLVIHAGTVPGTINDTTVLNKLMGCKFAFHPNNSPTIVQPLKPHPVVEGVNTFYEVDEHYHLEIIADDIDIFMASYSPAQGDPEKYESEPYFNIKEWICTAGFTRSQGKGRVCVLTPGHLLEVWLNPEYQRTIANALRWCAWK